MNNEYTVYMHITPNNKKYIGITHQIPKKRWGQGRYYYQNKHFSNAIKKYGWENIKHEILFINLTKEEAEQKEIELIAQYKSNNSKFGYNIANGGNSYGMHSEETKKKISENNIKYWKGKHLSQETIKKKSEALKKAYKEGKKVGFQCKKIEQLTLDGISIKVWNSALEISKELNYSNSIISKCCKNKKEQYKGYKWRFFNEQN